MNFMFKLFLTTLAALFPSQRFVIQMRILKAFWRFTKNLLNFHSGRSLTWEIEYLFVCLLFWVMILTDPKKEKFYENYLENSEFVACCCLVSQSCLTLCGPGDCSPPGSSILGISQARVLEWVAISFSRGSSPPRNWTQVYWIARRIHSHWATWEALSL